MRREAFPPEAYLPAKGQRQGKQPPDASVCESLEFLRPLLQVVEHLMVSFVHAWPDLALLDLIERLYEPLVIFVRQDPRRQPGQGERIL